MHVAIGDSCLHMQARLDRLPTMMCNAVPVSRAWSLGQLGDDMIGAWGPSFHPQACHSDPISFYSTRGIAIAFSEVSDQGFPASTSERNIP